MVTPEALQFAQALRMRQPNKMGAPQVNPMRPQPAPGMAAPRTMAPPAGYTPVAPPLSYSPRPAQVSPMQRRNAMGVQRLM